MNICMFTNTYLPHVGGVARSVATFAEDLLRLGQRVLVVAPSYGQPGPADGENAILRMPALKHLGRSDFAVSLPVPFYIKESLDSFAPQLIHSHHPYLLGDTALRTALRRRLPIIFTHHTLYENYTHYIPMEFKVMRHFVSHLATAYANRCTRVIAPSPSLAQLIRKRGVTTPIEVLSTGIDLPMFSSGNGARFRTRFGIPPEAQVLGHVGRLAQEKNIGFLAKAAALHLQRSEKSRFLVVGSGDGEEELRSIFARQKLGHRLTMPGVLTGAPLADAYSAMDLFVFASLTETQGLVLVEALAAGVPVVALNATGTRDIVKEGVNGRLLPRRASRKRFAEAISELMQQPPAAMARWRDRTRKTAAEFSRENSARRLVSLYEQVLAEAPRGVGGETELAAWEKLLNAIRSELTLLVEKSDAIVGSFRE